MYTTVEDVRDILRGDGTTDKGSAADLNNIQIDSEIIGAQQQVDSTLRNKYTVPFVVVPELISHITRDIAAYLCDLNYRKSREYESDNYPIIRRHDRARELLDWLRTGVISLSAEFGVSSLTTSEVVHMYEHRILVEADIWGWRESDW